MALPSVGGGYQFNDGNLNELKVTVSAAPATATATRALTRRRPPAPGRRPPAGRASSRRG